MTTPETVTSRDFKPDISFVIPVRDDAARLERCLASIRNNDYPAERIEVIVVDNGSTDGSVVIAEMAAASTINAPHKAVAELRNIGAATSRANVLAFVDADHVLGRGWIEAALEWLSHGDSIGAVGSIYCAPENGTWVQRAYDRLRGRQAGKRRVEWLGGGNIAVSRRAFETVGGFDTALETCEDVDFCKKLRANGYTLMADDRLVSTHVGDPETLSALFRAEMWRGRSNLAVSFRRPVTLREMPSAIAPIIQLAGLGLAPIALLLSGTAASVIGSLGLLPCAVVPAVRAARMSVGVVSFSARELVENAIVAFVYDLARAIALVAFAGHKVRRP